jgi:response regulator RpfG family c-di-GMP phosphodiesterase
MKKHSEFGEEIVRSSGFKGCRRAALAIRHHHEHFDGRGYPDGLVGDDIPICSRIITIADSYDAMAVTRHYHAARKHQEIMNIMRSEIGTKLDPQFMEIFCKEIERSPFRVE